MTVAFSADGEKADEEFLRPLCEAILSDAGQRKSFLELTVEISKIDCPFVTDLLHCLKCLRNLSPSRFMARRQSSTEHNARGATSVIKHRFGRNETMRKLI
jgi:hypothetical protein